MVYCNHFYQLRVEIDRTKDHQGAKGLGSTTDALLLDKLDKSQKQDQGRMIL
jgi:hypothetical protein